MTYQVVQDVRNEAFRKIQILPLKYIDNHPSGEIVSRVIADVDQFADGLLMGFTQQQIKDRYNEIVKFSELGKFINSPVSTYSSGMYSKLAFSITAILETEIMLIDEVLSVGDIRFKKKSFKKMRELIQDNDRTVMVVSHSVETVRKLCTRVIWLHDGKIIQDGPTEEVLDAYTAFMEETEPAKKKTRKEKLEEKMLKTMEEV